jgi:hypothetical protein
MALTLDFCTKLSNGCKTLNFIDESNWGAPEYETSDAISATLTLESSSGTITELDVFPLGLPDDTEAEFDITSILGLSENAVIPNQYFYLTYTVTVEGEGTETFTKKRLIFIDCQAAACVDKKLASIDICDLKIPCGTASVNNAILAHTLLKAARQAACCNQTERWSELIAMVMKLCKSNC